jgi:uncharacterized protein
MSYFVVHREAGPRWTDGKSAFEQPGAAEHSAFMNQLAEQGFVLLAGPLAGSEQDRIRVAVIIKAVDAAEIRERLADDPWARAEMLRVASVEPWNVFVGGERLAAAADEGSRGRPGQAAA